MHDIPWMTETRSRHQNLNKVWEWLTPHGPLAITALDSLMLAKLASVTGDAQLTMEAQKQHVKALQYLRGALDSTVAVKGNAILSAVDALGVCEMFEELSESPSAWRHHAKALALILQARGPASLDYDEPLLKSLVFNAVHINLMDALSSRTAFVFGKEPWLRHSETNCKGRQWCLTHIACRIPALLELVDRAGSSKVPSAAIYKLHRNLSRLNLQFAQWLDAWYFDDINVQPSLVDVKQFPTFITLHPTATYVFPMVYQFDSLESALGHVSFWLMRLPVLEAIQHLFSQIETQHLFTSSQRLQIESQARQCADGICQSAPALIGSNPQTSVGVQTMRGVYLWTLAWYTKNKCHVKAEYCRGLLRIGTINVTDVEKGVVAHDKRTISANALVARRILWLESVGPSSCYMERFEHPRWCHAIHSGASNQIESELADDART